MWMFAQLVIICLSCIVFSLFNACFPKCLRLNLHLSGYPDWKWRNITISLVHSAFSGFCAFYLTLDYVFAQTSSASLQIVTDTILARFLLCVSIGYFIYDSLLSYAELDNYPGRVEIIVHHVITMTTLGLVLFDIPVMRIMFPCCIFGLVIEINNIFIHIRSLMEMVHRYSGHPNSNGNSSSSKPLHSPLYQLNSVCVLVSIFVFRFLPLYWITGDLAIRLQSQSLVTIALLHFPIVSIVLISSVIFWRILQEDFLSSHPQLHQHSSKHSHEHQQHHHQSTLTAG